MNDRMTEESRVLGVGIVGWGWMGQVHARTPGCGSTILTRHCGPAW
jgi:hypothetical protein